MRLLLINPKYPESFWSFKWAVDKVLPSKRAINPPLGLATLAALCPPSWEVQIVDENIESLPLAPEVDVIGICGMGVQFERQAELLCYYHEKSYYVVAGGSFASLCPERYSLLADTVIAGEAEYIWPRFCADFENGCAAGTYRETGVVTLSASPTPRFDLLRLDRYSTATVQFSRGCPFRCEFCDIIVMFGRKPRHKELPQVERELDALRALGVKNVFFVDDNLIGNRAAAKALLRRLIAYQDEHDYRFSFGTEVSINLAQDAELLQLMRQARFGWVFVGIESPDPQTLKDTRKTQNTHEDVLKSVRTIYSHGIDVLGGFIVGFDNDTLQSFEHQYRFIMKSGIQAAMVGLLTALPKTPLYERLQREGRLRADAANSDNTKLVTNVVPKRIGYEQMIAAYKQLYRRLLTDRAIADRIRNKLRHLGNPAYDDDYSLSQRVGIVLRLLRRGVLPGGPSRVYHFTRSFPWHSPRKIPPMIVDWIAGLAMRDYVQRHFERTSPRMQPAVHRRMVAIRAAVAEQIRAGRVALTTHAARIDLRLSLDVLAGRRFFASLGAHLEALLSLRGTSLTLSIDRLRSSEIADFERMLARLARHGDRVFVVVSTQLQHLIRIDSSRFNLVLRSAGT